MSTPSSLSVPANAFAPAPTLGHVRGIDGLRGIAVALVLLFHADLGTASGGFLGVELFFVISGFLVTSLLVERSLATGHLDVRAFWLGRVKRLFPALVVVSFASLALAALCARDALAQTWNDLPAALLGAGNLWHLLSGRSYFMASERPPLLLHLWSLGIEAQFYLLLPLVLAAAPWRRARFGLCLGAVAVALLSSAWMALSYDPTGDTSRVYFATDTRLSGLAMGSALALGLPLYAAWSQQRQLSAPACLAWRNGLEATSVIALGLLSFVCFRARGFDAWLYRGGFLLVDVLSATLILAAVRNTVLGQAFGAAPLAWLGRRSYGLYLVHWPIFAVTRPELDSSWPTPLLFALRLGFTFAAAELCHRYVEQPLRHAAWTPASTRLGDAIRIRFGVLASVALFAAFLPVRDAPAKPGRLAAAPAPKRAAKPAAAPPSSASNAPISPPIVHSEHVARCGTTLDEAWPKTVTVLTDSVTLPIRRPLEAAMPGFRVEVVGRPALMVKQVVGEFLNERGVGSIVVVGLAYNSLFEKERKNFETWSRRWDRDAERLLADLRARGAKKVVWITLREPSPERVTPRSEAQYRLYAWFFPYVNERLWALANRHPELALADWEAVSDVDGITKDLIHLNRPGFELMARTIAGAALGRACSEGTFTIASRPLPR